MAAPPETRGTSRQGRSPARRHSAPDASPSWRSVEVAGRRVVAGGRAPRRASVVGERPLLPREVKLRARFRPAGPSATPPVQGRASSTRPPVARRRSGAVCRHRRAGSSGAAAAPRSSSSTVAPSSIRRNPLVQHTIEVSHGPGPDRTEVMVCGASSSSSSASTVKEIGARHSRVTSAPATRGVRAGHRASDRRQPA
jgi:hypothetical protein